MPKNINLAQTALLVSKIMLTISSLFLFLAWLMLMTNNFYPKAPDLIVSKIINTSIQIMIWPITIITLFVFIMPIWVTTNKKILAVMLSIAIIITIVGITFLFSLNINYFWFIWLVVHIFTLLTLIVMIIVIFSNVFLIKVKPFKLNQKK